MYFPKVFLVKSLVPSNFIQLYPPHFKSLVSLERLLHFSTTGCVNVDTNGDMIGINVSGCAECNGLF